MLPLCAKIAVLGHFGPNPGQKPFYLLEGIQLKVFPAPEILVWAGCPTMLPLCAKIAVLRHFGLNPGQRPFYLIEGIQLKVFPAPEILV